MTSMTATHTVEELLAVEAAPYVFVLENGLVMTRTAATKWGDGTGLDILEYTGSGTVEVDEEAMSRCIRLSDRHVETMALINAPE